MTAYRVATRYSLLVLARNRLAMVVLVGFIPLLVSLAHFVVTRDILALRYRATGELLHGSGEKFTMITCALSAVTLLVGFAMFSSAKRAGDFDQRLVAAGYPRTAVLLAKLTTLIVAAAVVSAYATAWMWWYWPMEQPVLMGVGVFCAALLYGAIGLFLALFLPGELEGMFTIIMASLIDLAMQNPIANPAADAEIIKFFPAYGAMQTCLGAGFTDVVPLRHLAISIAWTAVCAMVAVVTFALRTRIHATSARPLPQGSG